MKPLPPIVVNRDEVCRGDASEAGLIQRKNVSSRCWRQGGRHRFKTIQPGSIYVKLLRLIIHVVPTADKDVVVVGRLNLGDVDEA